MELFLELILTVSLTLIFTTSLFIKLASMPSNDTDNNRLTEESMKIDKFQWMPFNEEMIKLEECPNQGKSSVEFYDVLGVEKEDDDHNKFQDVVVVETLESKDGKTEDTDSNYDDNNDNDNNNDNDDDDKVEETRFGSEDENGGGRKLCEIEIESVEEEEEEEKNEIMDDWEEIGRKDFEELLGNKTGLYYVGVGVDDYGK